MTFSSKTLFISIHPKYAEMILLGRKTVELRKQRPNVAQGCIVFLYASSPVKKLLGMFEVDTVIEDDPETLWSKVHHFAGVSRSTYKEYYSEKKKAFGIVIKRAYPLERTIELDELRTIFPGFHPPQSYRYLDYDDANLLVSHTVKTK